jgi:predicted membrane channel-forming protein YqfA (hemolysin III family)
MGLPASGFQLTTVILVAIFTTTVRRSRVTALVLIYLMAIAGILMVKLLPENRKLPRLAGYWLVTAIAPVFPVMLSLFASNTAGFTKKSTVAALIFVGYCVGNLIGPQFFKDSEAPNYHVRPIEPWITGTLTNNPIHRLPIPLFLFALLLLLLSRSSYGYTWNGKTKGVIRSRVCILIRKRLAKLTCTRTRPWSRRMRRIFRIAVLDTWYRLVSTRKKDCGQ